MKKITNLLWVGLCIFSFLFVCAFVDQSNKKIPIIKEEIKTLAITCSTSEGAASFINSYSKQGWRVKFVEAQPVATSIITNGYDSHRELYGKFLIIFEK